MTHARPDKHDPSTVRDATWAVHGGNRVDPGTGALRTPVMMANSYLLPPDPSAMNWSSPEQLVCTRNGAVNQQALETKLAASEGGDSAVVFATGVAALHGVFFTLLRSGDHVIVSNVSYEAVWRLFTELLPERYGIEATFVDTSDLDAVRAAVRPSTRLVHVETIANPTTRVADIAGLAAIAPPVLGLGVYRVGEQGNRAVAVVIPASTAATTRPKREEAQSMFVAAVPDALLWASRAGIHPLENVDRLNPRQDCNAGSR